MTVEAHTSTARGGGGAKFSEQNGLGSYGKRHKYVYMHFLTHYIITGTCLQKTVVLNEE